MEKLCKKGELDMKLAAAKSVFDLEREVAVAKAKADPAAARVMPSYASSTRASESRSAVKGAGTARKGGRGGGERAARSQVNKGGSLEGGGEEGREGEGGEEGDLGGRWGYWDC
ncbi:hypothetical protein MY10362_008968 [Beauveria mimosiformis]